MSQTIEARSLSTLTALASNPPSYPRNPTHGSHEPLVLYIARVPGSKDVFLSPMKPREKVVTAEDIQSSLYFLHFEQPEDAHLIDPPEFNAPNYSDRPPADSPSVAPIQRKAVPGHPTGPGGTPVRRPVPGTLAPITDYENAQNVNAGNYAQRPNALGPNYTSRRSFDSTQNRQENARPNASPRRSFEKADPGGTSLTLIRRDPASGAQWNVARIEDPPVLNVSSSSLNDPAIKRKMGTPVYIEVYNPGYSKFLQAESTSKPPIPRRPTDKAYQMGAVQQPLLPEQRSGSPAQNHNTFRRRLWMEGSQYSNGGFGRRKNSSYDYNAGQAGSNPHGSPSPGFLTHDDQSYGTIQVSDRPNSFRGYVFTSPWNGRCEFVTGAGGGTLKCRHLVPGLQGAPPATMQVSELRFNLPSSSKAPSSRGEETSKRASLFHRARHGRKGSSISLNPGPGSEGGRDYDDRMDLSLGQEFAGGGMGGKQAKLGKMILDDEGLKMMDLLVAANLALWWRAYEKASAFS